MSFDDVLRELKEKSEKSIRSLKEDMATIHNGSANPVMLDHVRVSYNHTPTPLRSLASVSVGNPQTLIINPWDRDLLKDIEKAILKANLGMTPNNDGRIIRLSIPAMTYSRRQELINLVYKKGEDKKIVLRGYRRDANAQIKKIGTEDQQKSATAKVQSILDEYCAQIDTVIDNKHDDLEGH